MVPNGKIISEHILNVRNELSTKIRSLSRAISKSEKILRFDSTKEPVKLEKLRYNQKLVSECITRLILSKDKLIRNKFENNMGKLNQEETLLRTFARILRNRAFEVDS